MSGEQQAGDVERLIELLTYIAEGRGRFNRDNHEFANNVIEDAKERASEALQIVAGLRERAAAGPVGWQPIETAPWRGPAVLLWKESTREHYVAARISGAHGPRWCTPDGYEILRPTHWMPLPPPPESEVIAARVTQEANDGGR